MNTHHLLTHWPALPDDLTLGNPTGIGIDSHHRIIIFHRAGRIWTSIDSPDLTPIPSKTILIMDRDSGKILDSWGDGLFLMPHGLTVDGHDNIWVTDVGAHQVFKFNAQGKLLMQLGESKVPGNDPFHFYAPTDVAVAADGAFYVSDGYGNNRVIKFSPAGEFLLEWGTKGEKEGEFRLPHAVELDDQGNVYVADRENCRIQVFTLTGQFITQWTDKSFGKISSIVFNKARKDFIVVDYTTSPTDSILGSCIIHFDPSGQLVARYGEKEGGGYWYHNVMVDDQDNIYLTDILRNSIRKYGTRPSGTKTTVSRPT